MKENHNQEEHAPEQSVHCDVFCDCSISLRVDEPRLLKQPLCWMLPVDLISGGLFAVAVAVAVVLFACCSAIASTSLLRAFCFSQMIMCSR